eukprot:3878883-Amphidinium_carterae.2
MTDAPCESCTGTTATPATPTPNKQNSPFLSAAGSRGFIELLLPATVLKQSKEGGCSHRPKSCAGQELSKRGS